MNSPPETLVSLCPVWKAIITALRACLCPPQRETEREQMPEGRLELLAEGEGTVKTERLFLPTMP